MALFSRTVFIFLLLFPTFVKSQTTCSALGQNPGTAFPVCGTSSFVQNTVPLCGNNPVPGPCSNDAVTDRNPFWYKFTCFSGGTLGFIITPSELSDDYDWQLFDVTGKSPSSVFTDVSLFVACNWSGEGGLTGASNAGKSLTVCAGFGQPLYSSMPTLIEGHQYLLLISHFTNTQSGYKLEFKGGSASITDTKPPRLFSAVPTCDGSTIGVKLNKKMRCNTLAFNGTDFGLSSNIAKPISAKAPMCASGFDMDSIVLTLDKSLPAGKYSLYAQKGSDGNTLMDYCDAQIPDGSSIDFEVLPLQPTPMDSLVTPACAPLMLQLVFKKPMLCSSIDVDGSDFDITGGNSAVKVRSAEGNCDQSGSTSVIYVHLSAPVQIGGTYKITLKKGGDKNTLIDECSQETPAGSSLSFVLKDTVSAAFSYTVLKGCKTDTVYFKHDGKNGVNSWQWIFDDFSFNPFQNPVQTYSTAGAHPVKLVVSNGFCADSAESDIVVDTRLKADFTGPDILCPRDNAQFIDGSFGPVSTWRWDYGNGQTGTSKVPAPQVYANAQSERTVPVTLVVADEKGCTDTMVKPLVVVTSCYIAVPNAFTPNGDGHNDFLFPANTYKADNLTFRVYNRFGQLIFVTKDRMGKWDGTVNGKPQDTGTYVWTLDYIHRDTGKHFSYKGTTILIR